MLFQSFYGKYKSNGPHSYYYYYADFIVDEYTLSIQSDDGAILEEIFANNSGLFC